MQIINNKRARLFRTGRLSSKRFPLARPQDHTQTIVLFQRLAEFECRIKPAISIGLQNPLERLQMNLWVLAPSIRRVGKPHGGCRDQGRRRASISPARAKNLAAPLVQLIGVDLVRLREAGNGTTRLVSLPDVN